jgi:hypothetical protein
MVRPMPSNRSVARGRDTVLAKGHTLRLKARIKALETRMKFRKVT